MGESIKSVLSGCRYWRVFGTGTFTSTIPSMKRRKELLFDFLRETARLVRVPWPTLLWAIRQERGERGDRLHYHWLIGASSWQPTISQMFIMNNLWDRLPGCGFSRNKIVYPENMMEAIEYHQKAWVPVLRSSGGATMSEGATRYESQKFGYRGTDTMLADSLLRLVGGRRVGVARCALDPASKNPTWTR